MLLAVIGGFALTFVGDYHRRSSLEQGGVVREETTQNITQILMHEPGVYTVLVLDPETKTAEPKYIHEKYARFEFAYDAPEDRLAWLVTSYRENEKYSTCEKLTFHIHPNEKILGAGWDHGKGGRGRTNVIE